MAKKKKAKIQAKAKGKPKKKKTARPKASPPAKAAAKKAAKKTTPKQEPSLGRPKVTGEEQLYMLFHEDYHARQVFDFLRVQTVKELEEYSPQQIVKMLSRPITDTVDRIRRKLAEKNRHLNDDVHFAVDFKAKSEEKARS